MFVGWHKTITVASKFETASIAEGGRMWFYWKHKMLTSNPHSFLSSTTRIFTLPLSFQICELFKRIG